MPVDPLACRDAPPEAPRASGTAAPDPDREAIELETERFARRVCSTHPRAFTDAKATTTKEAVIRQIRITLPPHPGRPRSDSVTRAWEMERLGVEWRAIYPECISGYATLNWKERRKGMARLRNAVRARRGSRPRQARKNSTVISNNEKNDGALFAPVAPATVIG
jgi:hypothetical protein